MFQSCSCEVRSKMKESDSSGDGSTTKSSDKVEYEEEEIEEQPKNGSCSSNSTVEENERKKSSTGVRQYIRSKTPRLRWTPDLHHRFIQAVERLGGQERATPKQVLQMMNIKGLNIAHVKSHLQMYRSKKIDDQGQVINDQRHLMGNWDHHTHIPRQLDHMLQGYNQRLLSNYSDVSWTTSHMSLMNSLTMGGETSAAERLKFYASLAHTNFGDGKRETASPNRFSTEQTTTRSQPRDEYRFPICAHQNPYQPQSQARRDNTTSCKETEEAHNGAKRKATDCDLDLSLSLNVVPGQSTSDGQKGFGEEDVDFSLSLSLCSPSKKRKQVVDMKNLKDE